MTFLYLYATFCLATAIAAVYELFWPVIQQIRMVNPESQVAQYWKTALATLFVSAIVVAPVLFFACVIPSKSERFREVLTLGLEKSV